MQTFIDIDTNIFLYLNSLHNVYWDYFMMMFSGKLIWAPMYAAFLWMVWRCFSWRTALTVTLMGVVLIALADQTCASVIRPYVERLRPSRLENELSDYVHVVNDYRGGLYSFPSCHAANSFAFAVFASLLMRRKVWTVFILLWALLNSYSRIYLGVHFPGDLLVGALLGTVVALAVYWMTRYISQRWSHNPTPFAISPSASIMIAGHKVHPVAVPVLAGSIILIFIAIASI